MGLDMYACTLREPPAVPVDFEVEEATALHYWRKHPNLHGWMERLYREKGGNDPRFNCVNLQLTADDLDRLETAIRDRTLPPTEGFFFGVSDGREDNDDLTFVAKAREALAGPCCLLHILVVGLLLRDGPTVPVFTRRGRHQESRSREYRETNASSRVVTREFASGSVSRSN
ncbi:hypothetical protein ABIA16_004604 [Sinorhizobium fredii]